MTDNTAKPSTTEQGAPLHDAAPQDRSRVGADSSPQGIEGQGAAPAAGPDKASGDADVRPAVSSPGDGREAAPDAAADATPDATPDTTQVPPDYSQLVLPEGYAATDPMMEGALALFGEHLLPAGVAQKLVDFAVARDREVAAARARTQAEEQSRAWSDVVVGWQQALRTELGSSAEFTGAAHGGDRLKEMQALSARAIDAYGGDDAAAIRQHLATYALGDHPAFARFLARAGRSVSEDRLPRSGDGASQVGTAETLYPDLKKE